MMCEFSVVLWICLCLVCYAQHSEDAHEHGSALVDPYHEVLNILNVTHEEDFTTQHLDKIAKYFSEHMHCTSDTHLVSKYFFSLTRKKRRYDDDYGYHDDGNNNTTKNNKTIIDACTLSPPPQL